MNDTTEIIAIKKRVLGCSLCPTENHCQIYISLLINLKYLYDRSDSNEGIEQDISNLVDYIHDEIKFLEGKIEDCKNPDEVFEWQKKLNYLNETFK